MQENSFSCYGRIKSVNPPIATGSINNRNEPLYNVTAALISVCGSQRDETTNTFSDDVREVDVVFQGITNKQIEMLVPQSEVLINGGSVISTDLTQKYPRHRLSELLSNKSIDTSDAEAAELVAYIAEAVSAQYNKNFKNVVEQLSLLITDTRRKTVVRVKSGTWRLKATDRQVSNARSLDSDYLE